MPLKPAILEWGTGVDVHGQNYTEAARRAVWDAIHHSSLTFLGLFGESAAADMVVEVTIAIPKPDEVDEATILAALPHGKPTLNESIPTVECLVKSERAAYCFTACIHEM